MKNVKHWALALSLALTTTGAWAADKHGHDHAKPRHGGVVVEVNEIEYELVTSPDGGRRIHVADHGKPVSTKGWSGKITAIGGDKASADLVPGSDSTLETKGPFKVASGARVLATIQAPDKKPVQVRFTVK